MPKYQFVVLSNPLPGREDEFNEWYDNDHVREILQISGVESASRLRLVESPDASGHQQPYRYLALYQIETEDIQAVIAELSDPSSRVRSDVIDLSTTAAWMYEQIGERHSAGAE